MTETRKAIMSIFIIFIFSNILFGKPTIGKEFSILIKKGQLNEAKTLLIEKEKVYGVHLLKSYFVKLGNSYLKEKQYINALYCYKKSNSKKVKKFIKKLSRQIGERHLINRQYKKALEFFKSSDNIDLISKISYVITGDEYISKGKYNLALENYEKSGFLDRIAKCYGIIADYHKKQEKIQLAKLSYTKAIENYTSILKSFEYIWLEEYNKDRLRCMSQLKRLEKSPEEREKKFRLRKTLKGVGKYCSILREESMSFYCKEYVRETRDYSVSGSKTRFNPDIRNPRRNRRGGIKSKTFINSYQLIQKGNSIIETRKFLRSVSKRNKFSREVNWKSTSVIFKKIILGPLGILDLTWQPYNDYRIIGTELLNNEKAIVLECIPEFPLEKKLYRINNYLFGKVWISTDDFSVLKIEWEPKSIAFVNNTINTISSSLKTRYKYTIEYFLKKNGIRYPTKGHYSEYYVNKRGEKSTLLSMDIKYSDFRFFSVETESELRMEEEN